MRGEAEQYRPQFMHATQSLIAKRVASATPGSVYRGRSYTHDAGSLHTDESIRLRHCDPVWVSRGGHCRISSCYHSPLLLALVIKPPLLPTLHSSPSHCNQKAPHQLASHPRQDSEVPVLRRPGHDHSPLRRPRVISLLKIETASRTTCPMDLPSSAARGLASSVGRWEAPCTGATADFARSRSYDDGLVLC